MKKINSLLVSFGLLFLVLGSCNKKDEMMMAPMVTFSTNTDTITTMATMPVTIIATISKDIPTYQSWSISNKIISTANNLTHTFDSAGLYTLIYKAQNEAGSYEKKFIINVTAAIRSGGSTAFVTTLFEYMPAPGQFINKAPGDEASAKSILEGKGMISLGAWGGYIVLGFDHTVLNTANKEDILIYNNSMSNFSESGIVYVMQDENGNGNPDDTWYELAGSQFGKNDYKRNYSVTYYKPEQDADDVRWKDSDGVTGLIKKNAYHTQSYYPEWITTDEYTLTGSWLKGNIDKITPTYIQSFPYDWGYADNLTGEDKIDIDNAVDKDGNPVKLTGIDFVKIQTAILEDMGWLGELSTEVLGIEDLSFNPQTK